MGWVETVEWGPILHTEKKFYRIFHFEQQISNKTCVYIKNNNTIIDNSIIIIQNKQTIKYTNRIVYTLSLTIIGNITILLQYIMLPHSRIRHSRRHTRLSVSNRLVFVWIFVFLLLNIYVQVHFSSAQNFTPASQRTDKLRTRILSYVLNTSVSAHIVSLKPILSFGEQGTEFLRYTFTGFLCG